VSLEGYPDFELVLDAVEHLKAYGGPERRPPFSLIFRCADERVLPQHTYSLNHPALGEVSVFLVPIGKDAKGVSYQALFN
jgi:hypothetical protein